MARTGPSIDRANAKGSPFRNIKIPHNTSLCAIIKPDLSSVALVSPWRYTVLTLHPLNSPRRYSLSYVRSTHKKDNRNNGSGEQQCAIIPVVRPPRHAPSTLAALR